MSLVMSVMVVIVLVVGNKNVYWMFLGRVCPNLNNLGVITLFTTSWGGRQVVLNVYITK